MYENDKDIKDYYEITSDIDSTIFGNVERVNKEIVNEYIDFYDEEVKRFKRRIKMKEKEIKYNKMLTEIYERHINELKEDIEKYEDKLNQLMKIKDINENINF